MAKFRLKEHAGKHYIGHGSQRRAVLPGQECDLDHMSPAWMDKFEPRDVGARKMMGKALRDAGKETQAQAFDAGEAEAESSSEVERRGPGRPRKE